MIEFTPYGKTARLFKDGFPMVVSEKIDGTNAAVGIYLLNHDDFGSRYDKGLTAVVDTDTGFYGVYAQSRNRIITPGKGTDNYGFAQWVQENAEMLVRVLGVGLHYGEWWGLGIARNYGMGRKVFSLFNTHRFRHLDDPEARLSLGVPSELRVVPVIQVHTFDTNVVLGCMKQLEEEGSLAAHGFMQPEGVVVFLPTVNLPFKVTFDGDKPKWQLEGRVASDVPA